MQTVQENNVTLISEKNVHLKVELTKVLVQVGSGCAASVSIMRFWH